MIDSELMNL